jgi:transposase
LGIAELVVLFAHEVDGEVWVHVETKPGRRACAVCGGWAESKERPTVLLRDLEIAGRPTVLVWRKRRLSCVDPDCEMKSWTEQVAGIAPRAVLTDRAKREIARRVGQDASAVSTVANAFGVSWATAWRAFREEVTEAIDDPTRIADVEALGVDETGFLAATARRRRIFATGMVDVRRGILIDIIEGRSARILASWLASRSPEWLEGVQIVCIDPLEAYRAGLSPSLSHAVIVADPFHMVRLGNRAVDQVRRRTQQTLTGHRGRRGDPLYDIRKLLLSGHERLDQRARDRLDAALAAGDPKDEVLEAFVTKEHLREVYAVDDPDDAIQLLEVVLAECADSDLPELRRLGRTLARWQTEIINHHRTGDSNGPTEAMNLLIKKIKRAGCGFTNFDHYRLRVLAHCGLKWQTQRAARIRNLTPRSAA